MSHETITLSHLINDCALIDVKSVVIITILMRLLRLPWEKY